MQKAFQQRIIKLRRWTVLVFALMMVIAWVAYVFLSGQNLIAEVDYSLFQRMQTNGITSATNSLLYALFLGGPFYLGLNLQGFYFGAHLAVSVQLLLEITCLAYGCYWLYRKGLPLWVSFLAAVVIALVMPNVIQVGQTNMMFLGMCLIILLVLKVIDSLRHNAYGLRIGNTLVAVLVIFGALILLDLIFLPVAFITTIILSAIPTRDKMRVFGLSMIMLVICSMLIFVILPSIGISQDISFDLLRLLPDRFELWISIAPVLEIITLVWLVVNRSYKYLVALVPFAFLSIFIMFYPSSELAEWLKWVLDAAMVLSFPALLVIPFLYEYNETKAQLRKHLLSKRKNINEADRVLRSQKACQILLDEIKKIDPGDGYIGLYSAFGSELSLDPLKAALGALGYRMAYPARVDDNNIEFHTTIGVTDEYLLEMFATSDPFAAMAAPRSLDLPQLDAKEFSVMVLPCVGIDKDNNRLGYGKGCYDRYLIRLDSKTKTYVVAFSEQLVDSVPIDYQDIAVHERVIV